MIRSMRLLDYTHTRTFTTLRENHFLPPPFSPLPLKTLPEQKSVLHFPPLARLDLYVDDQPRRGDTTRRADAQGGDCVPDVAAILQAADVVVRARRLGC